MRKHWARECAGAAGVEETDPRGARSSRETGYYLFPGSEEKDSGGARSSRVIGFDEFHHGWVQEDQSLAHLERRRDSCHHHSRQGYGSLPKHPGRGFLQNTGNR
jgi:hypothetical protein